MTPPTDSGQEPIIHPEKIEADYYPDDDVIEYGGVEYHHDREHHRHSPPPDSGQDYRRALERIGGTTWRDHECPGESCSDPVCIARSALRAAQPPPDSGEKRPFFHMPGQWGDDSPQPPPDSGQEHKQAPLPDNLQEAASLIEYWKERAIAAEARWFKVVEVVEVPLDSGQERDPDAAILADAGLKDARRRLIGVGLLLEGAAGDAVNLAINNIDAAIAVVGKDGNDGASED